MADDVLTDLSPEALARAIEENEIAYNRYRAGVAGWDVLELPGALLYRSGLTRSPYDNGVLRTDFAPDEADARIAEVIAYFRDRRLPFSWWGGPSRRPADLGHRLVSHGLTTEGDDPGMAARLDCLTEDVPAPAGLTVERVRDDAAARRFLATNRLAQGGDPDVSSVPLALFAPATYDEREPLQLFVASLEGEPVATAQLFLGAGVAGVYFVATTADYRRRGIGAAVTLAALRRGRELGYRAAVLGATPLGRPLYERLGFATVCTLQLHEWHPPTP